MTVNSWEVVVYSKVREVYHVEAESAEEAIREARSGYYDPTASEVQEELDYFATEQKEDS